MRGARRAANHRRPLLSSTNRGLATTDCSLQLWEGEVVAAIHYSPSVLLLAHFNLAAVCFFPLLLSAAAAAAAATFALRNRVAYSSAHIGISGKGVGDTAERRDRFAVDANSRSGRTPLMGPLI